MTWKVHEIEDNALRLLCVDGLGGATLWRLIKMAGGLNEAGEAVAGGNAAQWLPAPACDMLKARMHRMEVDSAREAAEAIDAQIVIVTDDDFPRFLAPLPACPNSLWYLGSLDAINEPSVAVVGARRCSQYGIEQANAFAKHIAASDMTVISGGARGIDAAAHRGSLRNGGLTCAVLGSGLHVVYPPEHASLFNEIVSSGGVVLSEFPCHLPPRPANFPRRNRIISGLSAVTLVIEAAKRSGALITARISVEEHGRQSMALPGRIGDAASAGCLQAICDGWMGIAIDPNDVVAEARESWNRLVKTCEAV